MKKVILISLLLFQLLSVSFLLFGCGHDVVSCTKEVLTIVSKSESIVKISGDKFTMDVTDKHLIKMAVGTTFSAIVMRKYDDNYNPKEITVINDISQ
jgi:hypothetical protein